MPATYDVTVRPGLDTSALTVNPSASAVGGGVGLRVAIDESIITTREQAFMALEIVRNEIMRRVWPAA